MTLYQYEIVDTGEWGPLPGQYYTCQLYTGVENHLVFWRLVRTDLDLGAGKLRATVHVNERPQPSDRGPLSLYFLKPDDYDPVCTPYLSGNSVAGGKFYPTDPDDFYLTGSAGMAWSTDAYFMVAIGFESIEDVHALDMEITYLHWLPADLSPAVLLYPDAAGGADIVHAIN